jgi:hypothetical protein
MLLCLSLPLGRSAAATEDPLKLGEQSSQLGTILLSDGGDLEEGPHVEAGSLNLLTELSRTLKVLRLNLRESLYVLGRQLGSLLPLLLLRCLLSSLLLLLLCRLLSGLLLGCLLLLLSGLLLSLGVGVLLRRLRLSALLLRERVGLTCLRSVLLCHDRIL